MNFPTSIVARHTLTMTSLLVAYLLYLKLHLSFSFLNSNNKNTYFILSLLPVWIPAHLALNGVLPRRVQRPAPGLHKHTLAVKM
jgi:hypothetical protein